MERWTLFALTSAPGKLNIFITSVASGRENCLREGLSAQEARNVFWGGMGGGGGATQIIRGRSCAKGAPRPKVERQRELVHVDEATMGMIKLITIIIIIIMIVLSMIMIMSTTTIIIMS